MIIGCEYTTEPVSELSQNKHNKYCMYCSYIDDIGACREFRQHVNATMIKC